MNQAIARGLTTMLVAALLATIWLGSTTHVEVAQNDIAGARGGRAHGACIPPWDSLIDTVMLANGAYPDEPPGQIGARPTRRQAIQSASGGPTVNR